MKTLLSYLVLWFALSYQSLAAIMYPIGGELEAQEPYLVELQSISYFYRLNIYDENHILLDSTIQFTQGYDLEAFVFEDDDGDFKVMVVMNLDESTEAQDTFTFNGEFLFKS